MNNKIFKCSLIGISVLLGAVRIGYPADPDFKINADQPEKMFLQAPYLSPKIIQDLSAWISDTGDQVTSINLLESQGSNRYFGDIKANTNTDDNPYIYVRADNKGKGSSLHFTVRELLLKPQVLFCLFPQYSHAISYGRIPHSKFTPISLKLSPDSFLNSQIATSLAPFGRRVTLSTSATSSLNAFATLSSTLSGSCFSNR